jgi:hypothetical protein
MKDLLEALAVFFGGIAVLAIVLIMIAGSWWLVGIAVAWVWNVTIATYGAPTLIGWHVGLLCFTVHILCKILFKRS